MDTTMGVVSVPKAQLFDAVIAVFLFWEDADSESGEIALTLDDVDPDSAFDDSAPPPSPYANFPRESPLLQFRAQMMDFQSDTAAYMSDILCDLVVPLLDDEMLLDEFYHYADEVRGISHIDLALFRITPSPPKLSLVEKTPPKE